MAKNKPTPAKKPVDNAAEHLDRLHELNPGLIDPRNPPADNGQKQPAEIPNDEE
jgi:hypothetical protein